MSDELIRKHEGHVTHLTLNRPQKANALSGSGVEALLDAVEYACTLRERSRTQRTHPAVSGNQQVTAKSLDAKEEQI